MRKTNQLKSYLLLVQALLLLLVVYSRASAQNHRENIIYLPTHATILPQGCQPLTVAVSRTGTLCVSCGEGKNILQLTFPGGKVINRLDLSVAPGVMLFSKKLDQLVVASPQSTSLLIVEPNLKTYKLLFIASHASPFMMALSLGGETAYVGDFSQPILYVMNLRSARLIRKIRLSAPAASMALSADGHMLYVGTSPQQGALDPTEVSPTAKIKYGLIDFIDTVKLLHVKSAVVPGTDVVGIGVNEQEKMLYALTQTNTTLSAVHTDTGFLEKKYPAPVHMESSGFSLLFDHASDRIFVTLSDKSISLINPKTFQTEAGTSGEPGLMTLWGLPGQKPEQLIVSGYSSGVLTTVSLKSNR